MAFVRTRHRKDGSPYYSATYRIGGRGGRQSSTSFADEKQANRFCKLVDSLGPDRAMEVAGVADTQRAQSTLTVGEWLERHIGSLSGVERKTVGEYERYATRDIGPALGAIPLAKLTRDDVADWVNTMFAAGAAGGTIENKHGFLSGALKRAVEGVTALIENAQFCSPKVLTCVAPPMRADLLRCWWSLTTHQLFEGDPLPHAHMGGRLGDTRPA